MKGGGRGNIFVHESQKSQVADLESCLQRPTHGEEAQLVLALEKKNKDEKIVTRWSSHIVAAERDEKYQKEQIGVGQPMCQGGKKHHHLLYSKAGKNLSRMCLRGGLKPSVGTCGRIKV